MYFYAEKDKIELQVFADASEDMSGLVAYLRSQTTEYSANLAFVIENCRVALKRRRRIASSGYGIEVEHIVMELGTKSRKFSF